MFNRALVFAGILLGCAACAEAQDVYSTGVQVINPGFVLTNPQVWGYLGPNFSVAGGYAQFSIDNNLILHSLGTSLGQISVYCKIVNPGDVVGTDWNPRSPFMAPFQMTRNQPFLLGLELDSQQIDSTGHGYSTRDRFGWAELEYTTSSGLNLLDSELAYNGLGIIAGTTTIVPEPSSVSILLSGIIGIALLHRRRIKR